MNSPTGGAHGNRQYTSESDEFPPLGASRVNRHDNEVSDRNPQTTQFVSGWIVPESDNTFSASQEMDSHKDEVYDRDPQTRKFVSGWIVPKPDNKSSASKEIATEVKPLTFVEFKDFLKPRSVVSEPCSSSMVNETNEQEKIELDKEKYRTEQWDLILRKPPKATCGSELSSEEWIFKLHNLPEEILRDVTEEVESRDLQYEVLLGPSERAALNKNLPSIEAGQLPDQHIDADLTVPNFGFVRLSDHSMASDPLNRAMLHTTNDAEFIEQAHAYRQTLKDDSQYSNVRDEQLEVSIPGSKGRFVMERGGLLRQLEEGECCSLIVLCSSARKTQQSVYGYCKKLFTTFKSCRVIDTGEAISFVESNVMARLTFRGIKTLILVEFWQAKDAMNALSEHPPGFLMRVPTRLLCGARNSRVTSSWEGSSNYSASFVWTNRPTNGTVVIHMHQEDNLAENCCKILLYNGYEVKEIRNGRKYISIFLRCKTATNGYICGLLDDEPVVAHIRACLKTNGVNTDRVVQQITVVRAKVLEFKSTVSAEEMRRSSELRNVSAADAAKLDEPIRIRIHRLLLNVAFLKEVWENRQLYSNREHRDLFLSAFSQQADYEVSTPWSLILKTDHPRSLSVQSAFVFFKNEEMGRAIVEHFRRALPDKTLLSFNRDDFCGVRCFSAYSHYILVRKDIRIACHKDIQALDINERENLEDMFAKGADCARIVDVDDGQGDSYCMLRVDAWPPQRSHDLKRKLEEILSPTTVDCSESETTGLMRQGYGWYWVQRQCKKNNVVVERDIYQGKLVLYGSQQEKILTTIVLNDFFSLRSKMKVSTELYISQPQYLRSMRAVLSHTHIPPCCVKIGWQPTTTSPRKEEEYEIGQKESGTKEGVTNAKTRNDPVVKEDKIDHDALRFCGSVDEFDRLRDYLDEIDEQLTSRFSTTGRSASRPSCVVCLVPVRRAFLCLQTCGHYCCLDCIVSQLRVRIRDRDLPLKCEFETCGIPLILDDIFHIFSNGERRDSEGLRELVNAAVDVLVKQSEGHLAHCRTAECTGLFARDDAVLQGSGIVSTTAVCDDCGVLRCLKCLLEPHPDISCDDHARLRDNPDMSVAEYIRSRGDGVEIRKCPTEHCGALIEKGEGCSHVHCSLCGVHFCWRCNYMSGTVKDVYAHMKDVHNSFEGGWRFAGNEVVEAPVDVEDADLLQALQRMP